MDEEETRQLQGFFKKMTVLFQPLRNFIIVLFDLKTCYSLLYHSICINNLFILYDLHTNQSIYDKILH